MVETRTLFLTITLVLLLFGWDKMKYFNSSQISLFIGEGCDFFQEWVVDVNKWVTFTKFLITSIFTFLSGVCKSQGKKKKSILSPWELLQSFICMLWNALFNFLCIWIWCLLECEPTLIMEEFLTYPPHRNRINKRLRLYWTRHFS